MKMNLITVILVLAISATFAWTPNAHAAYSKPRIRVGRQSPNTTLTTTLNTLETIQKSLGTLREVTMFLGKTGLNVQAIAGFMGMLGPAFGAVGALISVATIFIPKPDSPELAAVKKGFKEMHERFDVVDRKFDDLRQTVRSVAVYNSYKTNQDRMYNLQEKFEDLQNLPGPAALTELNETCQAQDPDLTLLWIYRNIVQLQVGDQLLDTMVKDVQYDKTLMDNFFQIITNDVTQVAMLQQVCLGVRFPTEPAKHRYEAEQAESRIKQIVEKMKEVEEKVKQEFHQKQLEMDLRDQLKANKDLSHKDFAKQLKTYLSNKYGWFYWGIYVYNPITGFELHTVTGYADSIKWVWREQGRNVVVNWQDKAVDSTITLEKAKVDFYGSWFNAPNCKLQAEPANALLQKQPFATDYTMVLTVKDNFVVAEYDKNTLTRFHEKGNGCTTYFTAVAF